ncbi:MAG: tetratricopeptide repeat protein [Kofleriaceae bacterium]
MKSIKSVMFAVMLSACGGEKTTPVDLSTFVPKAPVAKVSDVTEQPIVVEQPEKKIEVVAPTKFDDALAQGKDFAGKGDVANAKLMFEAAVKLDKKRPEPHMELAKLYIKQGERGLAMASANKAVKLAPMNSQAWNTKGRAELNRFAYDDAIEAFTKATELNPDNVWAWNNLGYTELQLKKYDEAAAHLAEATTKKGAEAYMFNNLGTALEHLDRLDDAREAYEGGAKLGSKEAVASRKRLEGVKSIAIVETKSQNPEVKPDVQVEKTFDNGEGPSTDGPAATPDDGTEDTTKDAAVDAAKDAAKDSGSDAGKGSGSVDATPKAVTPTVTPDAGVEKKTDVPTM